MKGFWLNSPVASSLEADQASGSGWGQWDEDFDPISRQGFLVKLASRGPCREWILAGSAQMAADSFASSGGLVSRL